MTARARALIAGAAYFAIVFVVGFVLGSVRTLIIVPQIGVLRATLLEAPLMLAASWFACGRILAIWKPPPRISLRLLMGATAFALLMAAEFVLAMTIFGLTPAQYGASFSTLAAQIGLATQIAFALLPLLRRR